MNYIWGSMILIGVIWGTLTGNVGAISEALLDSAREAVTLCITMLGVMGLWMGLMEIAKEAGLIRSVSRLIRPFIRFLFPNIPKDHPANEHITLNCVSNILPDFLQWRIWLCLKKSAEQRKKKLRRAVWQAAKCVPFLF